MFVRLSIHPTIQAHGLAVAQMRREHEIAVRFFIAVAVGVIEARAAHPAELPMPTGGDEFVSA
ncbi:MAG: hypothetical protein DWI31_02030 [Candidatus Aquidulcis sp.]|nr:MAG: hypothetical protein DWI31_02030 [Candidatus Aquidulcis sp.]